MSKFETFCQICFDKNMAMLAQQAQDFRQRFSVSRTSCVKCSAPLTADCKSPVPGCCFDCWTEQEAIEEKLSGDNRAQGSAADPPSTPDNKTAALASPDSKTDTVAQQPELGWLKCKKESNQNWFARIQMFLDGDKRLTQRAYATRWKDAMTEAERLAFQQDMHARANSTTPLSGPEAGRQLCSSEDTMLQTMDALDHSPHQAKSLSSGH